MNLNLLIVDDEQNIRSSLVRNLIKWADSNSITLETADSAASALDFLQGKNRDTAIIISDQRMPERKGSDFLKRTAELYPHIIRIMLSGHADISDMRDMVSSGMYSFLEKPWDKQDLLNEVSKALELYKLRLKLAEDDKIQKAEMEIASDFHTTFYKVDIPVSKHYNFHIGHQHARDLLFCGDYYDIIPLGEDRYLLLLGDVAGHGLKASFLTPILKSISFSDYRKQSKDSGCSPGEFLTWLNKKFVKILKRTPDLFIAFSACYIDGKKRTVKVSNGGQPPILLITPGRVLEISHAQMPLGVDADFHYEEETYHTDPGDMIFMYTDGISPDEINSARVNEPSFYELLQKMRTAREGADLLIDAMVSQTGGIVQDDDKTAISVQVLAR